MTQVGCNAPCGSIDCAHGCIAGNPWTGSKADLMVAPIDPTPKASDVQIGGDHYKKLKIQPMEYSMANGLDACQHTAIKYITRFRDKGGIADLEKAKHSIDLLIEWESKK